MVPERTQPRANPARGVALIATAVIVGFFLLRNWDGSSAGGSELVTSEAGSGDQAGAGAPSTTAQPATTVAARPPTEVTVRVMNATSVVGAAGNQSEMLQQNGYKAVEPDDAGQMLETTKILYAAGYEREAAELARAINSPPEGLEALANPPQVDPAGANLVVLLGKDLASAS